MKNIKILLPVLFLFFAFKPEGIQEVKDRMGIAGPISFNKKDFYLSNGHRAGSSQWFQEYSPAREMISSFKEKLSYTVYTDRSDVQAHFTKCKEELEKVCEEDPYYSSFVMDPKNKGERILFYTSSKKEKGKVIYTDFNIWRVVPITLEDQKTGILQFIYSRRSYGDPGADEPGKLASQYSGLVSQFSFLSIPKLQLK